MKKFVLPLIAAVLLSSGCSLIYDKSNSSTVSPDISEASSNNSNTSSEPVLSSSEENSKNYDPVSTPESSNSDNGSLVVPPQFEFPAPSKDEAVYANGLLKFDFAYIRYAQPIL